MVFIMTAHYSDVEKLDVISEQLLEQLSQSKHQIIEIVEACWRRYYDISERSAALQNQLSEKAVSHDHLQDERQQLESEMSDLQQLIEKAEVLDRKVSIVSDYLQGDVVSSGDIQSGVRSKQHTGFKIIEAQEDERKKLSRDIHDGPAQTLANVTLTTELIEQLYKKGRTEEAFEELHRLKDKIHDTLRDVRTIIYDLRPTALETDGLWAALERYLKRVEDETDVKITFQKAGEHRSLSQKMESALFRFVQENVRNACRHGQPGRVTVSMNVERQQVLLKIEDDGVGFDTTDTHADSFGIIGMKERVDLLNGHICFDSKIGAGTLVIIQIPLCKKEEESDGSNN